MQRIAALTGLALIFSPGLARAEDAPPPPTVRTISLNARDVPLRQALRTMSASGQAVLTVDRSVPDVAVRLTLRDVTMEHALRLLVRQASREVPRLDFAATDNGFRLFIRAAEAKTPEQLERENPNKVTGKFKNSPGEGANPEEPSTQKPKADSGEATDEEGSAASGVPPVDFPEGGVLPFGAGFLPNQNPLPDQGIPGTYIIPTLGYRLERLRQREQEYQPTSEGRARPSGYGVLSRRGGGGVGGRLRGVLSGPLRFPSGNPQPSGGGKGPAGGGFGVRPL
jgi:hypothetical protein